MSSYSGSKWKSALGNCEGGASASVSNDSQRAKSESSSFYKIVLPDTIYVWKLLESINEVHLYDIFSSFGQVRRVSIVKNQNGESKGYGFVTFVSEEIAQKLIKEYGYVEFNNQQIFIRPAMRKRSYQAYLRERKLLNILMNVKSRKMVCNPPAILSNRTGHSGLPTLNNSQTTFQYTGFPKMSPADVALQFEEYPVWVPTSVALTENVYWDLRNPQYQFSPCFTTIGQGNSFGFNPYSQGMYYNPSSNFAIGQSTSQSTNIYKSCHESSDTYARCMIQRVGNERVPRLNHDKRRDAKRV